MKEGKSLKSVPSNIKGSQSQKPVLRKLVLFPFPGDSIGGSLISTTLILQALQHSGRFDVRVILHTEGLVAAWLTTKGISFEIVSNCPIYHAGRSKLERLSDLFISRRSIRALINKDKPIIVHTNDIRTHITWAVSLFGTGVSHVWHQRTKWSGSMFVALLARKAKRRLAISKFVQNDLQVSAGLDSLWVRNPLPEIGQGVSDSVVFDKLSKCNPSAPQDLGLVCFVGAFNHQKRPEDFIEIVAQTVRRVGEKIKWVMIGKDGDYSGRELKRLAKDKGIDDVLSVHSFTEEISLWYSAMDILIAPSQDEGLGRNILEAMAARTVVIASRSGGHPELIQHGKTGFLEDLGDVLGFSDRIAELLSDESIRIKVGVAAHDSIKEEFNFRKIADEIMAIYEKF